MYPQDVVSAESLGREGFRADSLLQLLGDTLSSFSTSAVLREGIEKESHHLGGLRAYLLLLCVIWLLSFLLGKSGKTGWNYLEKAFRGKPSTRKSFVDSTEDHYFKTKLFIASCLTMTACFCLVFQEGAQVSLGTCSWEHLLAGVVYLAGFLLIKLLLLSSFSLVFPLKRPFSFFWQHFNLCLNLASLMLFVVLFLNEIVGLSTICLRHCLLGALLVATSFSFLSLARFFHHQRFSAFHLFVYLCALEILPICLLGSGINLIKQLVN